MTTIHDPTRARRIEMILREIDALPTPSPIALRLLSVASNEDADVREVISLIQTDPGMTARLLGLCARSSTGLGHSVTTVDRAVVMLGLDTVRAMLLSVDLHEFMIGPAREDAEAPAIDGSCGADTIDRIGLWRHSLAVGCAAERIVQTHADRLGAVKPDEAFVCGLLHDVGKIALDVLLPRSLGKAIDLSQRRCEPLTIIEQSLIGLDHTTVGKRLAERWGLPDVIRDALWLHGRPARSIPDLPHKKMIGVVTTANELARLMHVGESGDGAPPTPLARIAGEWGLDADRLETIAVALHERVAERSDRLGMEHKPPTELLVASLGAANRTLVQLNETHRARTDRLRILERVQRAVRSFCDATTSARDPLETLRCVAACGRELFAPASVIIAIRETPDSEWVALLLDEHGRRRRSATIASATTERAPTPASPDAGADPSREGEAEPLDPAITRALTAGVGLSGREAGVLRPMTLTASDAGVAMMLHPWRPDRERGVAIAAWRAATASAMQRARSERLAETLAELNFDLASARERAAEAESYARLGEMTAGAAHEMNNPLTIISGRAQLLRDELGEGDHRDAAQGIIDAASALSDLLAGLHFITSPRPLRSQAVDLTELLSHSVQRIRRARSEQGLDAPPIIMRITGPLPPVYVDAELFSVAIEELIENALEAPDSAHVELHVQTDEADDRLMVSVLDDGRGIAPEAMAHVTDPFFSRRDAGRGAGMGLAKVRRVVELHGGHLTLERRSEGGMEARITLEHWRHEHLQQDAAPTLAA